MTLSGEIHFASTGGVQLKSLKPFLQAGDRWQLHIHLCTHTHTHTHTHTRICTLGGDLERRLLSLTSINPIQTSSLDFTTELISTNTQHYTKNMLHIDHYTNTHIQWWIIHTNAPGTQTHTVRVRHIVFHPLSIVGFLTFRHTHTLTHAEQMKSPPVCVGRPLMYSAAHLPYLPSSLCLASP